MRLDKYLADMTSFSRNEIKTFIKDKKVKVNNEIIKDSSFKVNDTDLVYLNNELIKYETYEYYILNKPQGYLTATEDKNTPTVMDLIKTKRKDLFPVGRLDKDTLGLLLITNDGQLTHQLLSPKYHVDKKYYVELDKDVPLNAKDIFLEGIEFNEFISKPAKLETLTNNTCYITIHEGKYHQVKRMFEHVGCNVTLLNRIEFGNLNLKDLDVGQYRKLTEIELKELKELVI